MRSLGFEFRFRIQGRMFGFVIASVVKLSDVRFQVQVCGSDSGFGV